MRKIQEMSLDLKRKIFREATPSSKGDKLSKIFWEKGKSKFVNFRLFEEGLSNINQLYLRYKKVGLMNQAIEKRRRSWWFKLIQMILRLIRNPEFTGNK